MNKITELDLADAQLLGFSQASKNPDSIIELVESMGLTRGEWIALKKKGTIYLKDLDVEEVDKHFNV
jgi:hypothetical protein